MKTLEKLRLQMLTASETGTWIAVDGWPCPTEKEQNLRKVSQGDLNRAVCHAYMRGVPSKTIHSTLLRVRYQPLVDRIIALESFEP